MFFRVQLRPESPWTTVSSQLSELPAGTVVMLQTDHGLEPATVMKLAPISLCEHGPIKTEMEIVSIADEDEIHSYRDLLLSEAEACDVCLRLVEKHRLVMKLVRVEKFYGGGKMIFYFTAENRVDFRGLVKDLVQEYRTRIEMRQVGVRHETRMLGGVGICGREFCCSGHLKNFSSVSIKMAKEQDLPLNPNKISGVCNRLFCCLTHEYNSYKKERRKMPRPGRRILLGREQFLVRRQNVLRGTVLAENSSGEEVSLSQEQWEKAVPVKGKAETRDDDTKRQGRPRAHGGEKQKRGKQGARETGAEGKQKKK